MVLPPFKMKTIAAILSTGMILSACGGGSSSSTTTNPGGTADSVATYHELKGDFSENVTLDASVDYKINGKVNFLDGTTLTIPAGTTLYGSTASSYLAIDAGAQIDAQGTAADPIIFTSAADYNGTSTKDAQGEWGGVVLIGKAPIIGGTLTYEAGDQVGGGTDPADNSGTLKYVIIKHTGFEVEVDKELNGLSLLAVGSGTTISDIAIIGSADDGIELWGGDVDLTNVYVYNAGDDSLDTDLGYTGTFDNAVAIQKVVDATNYDSSGIEAGNDSDTYTSVGGTAGVGSEPNQATMATYKNVTIEAVGGAVYLKNDAGGIFDNVVITTKASTVPLQTDTPNQAMVTHRTTDTVDDLSGVPYGIQINAGGLVLNNTVTPEAIFATRTAKDDANGGNTTDPAHTENYWLGAADFTAAAYTGPLFVSSTTLNNGATAVDAGAAVNSTGAQAVTGADQSVFGWVLNELNSINTVVVSGDITADTTWSEGTNYALQGEVNVLSPAVLTVEPGVTVYGLTPSSYLAINKGAQIMADGTQAKPITFTSAADVAGDNGTDVFQGQWGGLTLIGNAPIVGGTLTYEAGTQVGGGNDPHDSSGMLNYVAIKNTGFEVEVDKELNGLSMLAVGDGTTVQNVAILGSADDGIELWGGTVNISNLYVYDAGDDSLDTDLGFTGSFTNAYAKQYTVDKTNYDSSGIETGNDSDTYTSIGGVVDNTTSPVADLSTIQQATMATYKDVTIEAVGGAIYLKNDAGGIFDNVSVISKDVQDPSQTATAGQAMITHRTTDTVDDLSGSPYGVQILSGGLELVNEVVPTDIYALTTSKPDTAGGCGVTCTDHIKNYWEGIPDVTTPDVDHLFYSDQAAITGADITTIWKGNAGTND